eukprot:6178372-Pleurochrysis_carterae.AAC.1
MKVIARASPWAQCYGCIHICEYNPCIIHSANVVNHVLHSKLTPHRCHLAALKAASYHDGSREQPAVAPVHALIAWRPSIVSSVSSCNAVHTSRIWSLCSRTARSCSRSFAALLALDCFCTSMVWQHGHEPLKKHQVFIDSWANPKSHP